jgi:uncharacterized membrane protein
LCFIISYLLLFLMYCSLFYLKQKSTKNNISSQKDNKIKKISNQNNKEKKTTTKQCTIIKKTTKESINLLTINNISLINIYMIIIVDYYYL